MTRILITGASSGIGEALALKYASAGATVFACGRNRDKLATLADKNAHIHPCVFDTTDRGQLQAATEEVSGLDMLILNAGGCEYIDDAVNFDASLFERIIQVNLIAVGYGLEAWLKKLNPGGRLVLVSSSVVYLPLPRAEAYGASKAGLSYLAKTLALDLRPRGIKVTLVHPGFVKTPLTDKNTFAMPCLMEVNDAAQRIIDGLNRGKELIHFPRRFVYMLKLLSLLPSGLLARLVNRNNGR